MLLYKNTINNQMSMSITIFGKEYDINLQYLILCNNNLSSLPAEIGKLINLQNLYLYNNSLSSLPAEIGKLVNLKKLYLNNNSLSSLPAKILKIKNIIVIDETSYDINNINMENEILIFSNLKIKLSNLPINTKEIWLKKKIINYEIKTPFNCVINFF
jgi:Leucine-rich repeat (LRR) protein